MNHIELFLATQTIFLRNKWKIVDQDIKPVDVTLLFSKTIKGKRLTFRLHYRLHNLVWIIWNFNPSQPTVGQINFPSSFEVINTSTKLTTTNIGGERFIVIRTIDDIKEVLNTYQILTLKSIAVSLLSKIY